MEETYQADSGGWSCPHNSNGQCVIMSLTECVPGKKGCVLSKGGVFSEGMGEREEDMPKRRNEPLNAFSSKKRSM